MKYISKNDSEVNTFESTYQIGMSVFKYNKVWNYSLDIGSGLIPDQFSISSFLGIGVHYENDIIVPSISIGPDLRYFNKKVEDTNSSWGGRNRTSFEILPLNFKIGFEMMRKVVIFWQMQSSQFPSYDFTIGYRI